MFISAQSFIFVYPEFDKCKPESPLEFHFFDDTINSVLSTFRRFEISLSVYKSGWEVFVHHLETVTGSLPNCWASHLPVWPVSANTAFILFSFCRSVFVSID